MSFKIQAWILALATVTLLPGISVAQDEPDDPEAAEMEEAADEATDEEAPASDPLSAAQALGGDVIIMKSGAIMGGVQILRDTSRIYEIQIVEGAEPMIIPRKQVESVIKDDIEPLRDARMRAKHPEPEAKLMVEDGQEVSPELTEKLMAVIPSTPSEFDNMDYVLVFQQVSKSTGVQIVVDPSLIELPPDARKWTIKISEEMKLFELLQVQWMSTFPDVTLKYELNKVVLHKKGVEPQADAPVGVATPPPAQFNFNRN